MTSFFELFFGRRRKNNLTAQEAFVGILLSSCMCDEELADTEVQGLITCLTRMKLYEGYDAVKCDQLVSNAKVALEQRGLDRYVDQCISNLPVELRETVYANVCNMVVADGVYCDNEERFVDLLREKLSIQKTAAAEIMDVIVVKNRG